MTIQDLAGDAEPQSEVSCGHANAEFVGIGDDARYLRCACGVLLVVQGGRMWALRPAAA